MAASRKREMSASSRRDRFSTLSDDVLGHVLSFLPTKEAACAAILSRRWRYVFGSVHTISFEETEGERASDWTTWFHETLELKSCSDELLDNVGAALLCRRRCAGLPVPLRSLRFAFDKWHRWDGVAVDQWLSYVLTHRRGGDQPGLHLDMRFHLGPVCASEQDPGAKYYMNDSDDSSEADSDSESGKQGPSWRYLLPRSLFSCTALRTLCVTHCRLKLRRQGMAIELPLLETMRLTAITDSGRSIQRLISSCPRLADLTLESLWKLETISVHDKRLRRFSIRCCHKLTSADIDASELRSLDYKGFVPRESLLSLHGTPTNIPSCTIDFCQPFYEEEELAWFGDFLNKIPAVTHLHLHLESLENRFIELVEFPLFSYLTRLTLRGCIDCDHTIDTVRWILELTPNLEVLTLQVMKSDEVDEIAHHDESSFLIPCLQQRTWEITIENYEGIQSEKILAKLLLRNALVLERLRVVFAKGLGSKRRNKLEAEIGKWGVANSEKIFTTM
ncbi:hypothetical protein QYE76_047150 [Lolium multiflorum]|uniref:F-box domain-containing protein n=1 Tax=Lolium multiflorum TaxID=4521 RepID=A0AAD8TR68_LOLMU|nr:hypothetical protein QYE76_047150 [Lolium multiflorum]